MGNWGTSQVLETLASLDEEELPDDFIDVRNEEYRLIRYPDRFISATLPAAQVVWSRTHRPLDLVVDEIASMVTDWGLDALHWWVTAATRPVETEAYLVSRGAVVSDRYHVLARELGDDPVEGYPPGVNVSLVDDETTLRDAAVVESRGWGRAATAEDELADRLRQVLADLAAGRVARFVAYVEGEPASTGVCRVDQEVARLYGAVTLPEYRSRGCYHAILHERLRHARAGGASIAITRGRPQSSGRLLVKSGFVIHGVETCLRLSLSSAGRAPSG